MDGLISHGGRRFLFRRVQFNLRLYICFTAIKQFF